MTLQEQYDQLEANVHAKLKELVKNSPDNRLNVYKMSDYHYLTIRHNALCFLDSEEYEYDLTVTTLSELINIITHNTNTK